MSEKVELANYDYDLSDPKQVAFYLRDKGEEECAELVEDLAKDNNHFEKIFEELKDILRDNLDDLIHERDRIWAEKKQLKEYVYNYMNMGRKFENWRKENENDNG